MAAYPDLPLNRDSQRTIINGSQVDMADDGTTHVRNFHTVSVYEFRLLHTSMSQAQANSLESFYNANKGDQITLTYKKDNAQYNVYFVAPPDIDHERGQWWTGLVVLRGVKAA